MDITIKSTWHDKYCNRKQVSLLSVVSGASIIRRELCLVSNFPVNAHAICLLNRLRNRENSEESKGLLFRLNWAYRIFRTIRRTGP